MGWLRPLPIRRRLEITAFALSGTALTFAGMYSFRWLPAGAAEIVRNLLPAPLMLFVYWQAGRFYLKPNEWIQNVLIQLDQRWIGALMQRRAARKELAWAAAYLEFSYLICYPLVPLGIAVLYASGKQSYVNRYWTIVFLSTYLCYIPLPFLQMLPPRLLIKLEEQKDDSSKLRTLNLGILNRASIEVNTFPSAHVASTMAASLALLCPTPVAGIIFLIIAVGIAGGAVLGRYHYTLDAALAIFFSGLIFFLSLLFSPG